MRQNCANETLLRVKLLFLALVFALPGGLLAQDSLAIRPLNPASGVLSVYELSFVTQDTLGSTAAIVIDFPQELDISNLQAAGSGTIKGGFKVEKNDRRVILERSGLGGTVAPNTRVELKFANVVNPPQDQNQLTLRVAFRTSKNAPDASVQDVPVVFTAAGTSTN